MYLPPHSSRTTRRCTAPSGEARLATLVTLGARAMEAMPCADPARCRRRRASGAIRGHIARANPQWRRVDASGRLPPCSWRLTPMSRAWCGSGRRGKVVGHRRPELPRVHAYGRIGSEDAPAARHRDQLTERHEGRRAQPWAVPMRRTAHRRQLRGIIGFRLATIGWKANGTEPEPQCRRSPRRHRGAGGRGEPAGGGGDRRRMLRGLTASGRLARTASSPALASSSSQSRKAAIFGPLGRCLGHHHVIGVVRGQADVERRTRRPAARSSPASASGSRPRRARRSPPAASGSNS